MPKIILCVEDEKEKIEFDLTEERCKRLVEIYGEPIEDAILKAVRKGLEMEEEAHENPDFSE